VLLAVGVSSFGACERGPALDPALADAPLPAPDAPVDAELAAAGAWYFQRNCVACHSVGGGDGVGPDLGGITERRTPVWIEAMIRRPDSMLVNDSTARALLQRYQVPMLDRQLDGPRIRAIMEFLRRADRGPDATR
jgi:mono/diheme cytochrome c family protein